MNVACKKFVEVDPPQNQITSATVYANDLSAASAVTAIYIQMISNFSSFSQGQGSISELAGLNADEFDNYFASNPTLSSCYTNKLTSTNSYFWQELYARIYEVNAVLEGLTTSSNITNSERQQLIGEAKFLRAFFYFYATNIYGDVPLATTTNYQVNTSLHRTSQLTVYGQIIADLKDAQNLLSDNFVTPTDGVTTSERVRPNRGAASALLSRAYLYNTKWDSAEALATTVINNTSLYNLDTLNGVFLANSNEAIWQLQPVNDGYNTFDAYFFVLNSIPGNSNQPVALTSSLMSTFEPGDERINNWVDSFASGQTYYFPYKYKVNTYGQPLTEYLMVLRLAEQYLIRAEARAEQNELTGAASDLNIIRMRAGLNPTTATSQADILTAIQHERRVELFTEWGHRWFDLRRWGTAVPLLSSEKPNSVTEDDLLYPVPQSEISVNSNLTQNPGYQP